MSIPVGAILTNRDISGRNLSLSTTYRFLNNVTVGSDTAVIAVLTGFV